MKKFILFTALCFVTFSTLAWNTPTLVSPSNGSSQWCGVQLDWGSVTASQQYEVQLDTSALFNSPIFQNQVKNYIGSFGSNSDTEHTFGNLLFGETYYWRVRAWVPGDTSAWTTVRSFDVRDYVNLDLPSNNTDQWSGLTLDWYSHPGVDFYEVQLDTVNTFNSSVFQNHIDAYINSSSVNSDTEQYFDDLYFGKTYFWRVRAINAVDTSEWSEVRSFNVRDFVNLDAPSNNTDQWAGLTLDWYAHIGIDFYEVQLDTVNTFNSSVFQNHFDTYINSSSVNNDTEQYFDDLYFGETYFWRVRAINAIDTSEWSEVRSFNVRDFVNLDAPSNNTDQWAGLTLDWYAHHGIDFYEVQLDTVNTFNSSVFQNHFDAYINSSSVNNDTEQYFDDLYFGKTYFWRVRAINVIDTSEWSEVRSFNVRDFVNLDAPSNNTDQWSGLTLDWYAHHGIDFYEVQLDTVNTFNSSVFQNHFDAYINSSSVNNDTEQYFDDLYFGETYFWRVRAINAVDTSEWSEVRSFNVRDYVNLDAPSNNTDQWSGLTLDWYAHYGIDFYEVQLDTVNTFNSSVFQNHLDAYINSSSVNNDTEQYFDDLYFGEMYFWRVRAINAVDTSEWSEVRSFTTRDYVTLNSPADFTVNVSTSGINLNWNAHYGVDFYVLEWDTTNLFNSTLLQTVTESYINSSSSNGDTQEFSGALSANQTYFWRVRAINAVDTTAWTSRVFSTGTGIVVPQIPTLISPANGSSVGSTNVIVDWTNATNAQGYEVEYSQSASFATSTVIPTTASQSPISGLSNFTTYFWRVRSVNNGYYSDWSATWNFTVDSVGCSPTSSTMDVVACDSYTAPSGTQYTNSGNFVDVIPNAAGCDSLISINLIINNSTTSTDVIEACDSYTWIDGITYTSSNSSATYVLSSSTGCDSTIMLNLTIQTVNALTSLSGETITANEPGAQYQWVDCDNNFADISGETNQTFTATTNGNYAVIVTGANGCSDTSACIAITTISLAEVSLANRIVVSPNPTTGNFAISTFDYSGEVTIDVLDVTGKLMLTTTANLNPTTNKHIDLSLFADGVYLVKISDRNQSHSIRVMKK